MKNFFNVSFTAYGVGVAAFTAVLATFLIFGQSNPGAAILPAFKTAAKFSFCLGAVVPLIYNTVVQKMEDRFILLSWIFWCGWGALFTYLLYGQG